MLCVGGNQLEVSCKVLLLDDTELIIDVKPSSRGHVLLDEVFHHFNLVEKDYFGIRFLDDINQTQWLDVNKPLKSQVKTSSGPPFTVYFGVRFYPADPCKLKEEITRYQFFLQVKKDILQGRLPVTFDHGAELAALSIQSELGDYDPRRHSCGYVSEFRFVPNQTSEFEERVSKLHRQLSGVVPSVAEYNYLDKVKWLDMYGVDLHPVLGEGSLEYFLGLTPTGIVVYKNKSKVGNYFWPRIVRVNFKGKTFTTRVRDKNTGDENTYAFELNTKPACKHLWKCTVEHHAFFRLNHVPDLSNSTSRLFSLGSKYRYSGRTEKEIDDVARAALRKEPRVERTPSKRHQRRSFESLPDGVMQSESRASSGYFDRKDIAIMKVITPDPVDRKYTSQSPKSTKSAPWEIDNNANVGLFTGGSVSPVSFRSEKMKFPDQPRRVASSGSESDRKRRNHRSRKPEDSDKESDKMKRTRRRKEHNQRSDSNVSEGSSKHHRHRKRSSKIQDAEHTTEKRSENGHTGGLDSNGKDPKGPNGSTKSLQSDGSSKKEGHRRRRRSKSPKHKPPEELKQYFQYGLVDPAPLSDRQKRDIPYMVVETTEPFRMKSPYSKHRRKSPHGRNSQNEEDLKWIPPKDVNEDGVEPRPPPPDVIDTAVYVRNDEVPESDESFVTAVGSTTTTKLEAQTAPIVRTKGGASSGREESSAGSETRSSHKQQQHQHHNSMTPHYSQNQYNKQYHSNPSQRQLQHFSNLAQREVQIDGPHDGRLIPIDGPRENPPPYTPHQAQYSHVHRRPDQYSNSGGPPGAPAPTPPRMMSAPAHMTAHMTARPPAHMTAHAPRMPPMRYAQSPRYHPPGMQPMYPANYPVSYPHPPASHPHHYRVDGPPYAYHNRLSKPFYEGSDAEPSWPDATSSPVSLQQQQQQLQQQQQQQQQFVKPGYYKDAEPVRMRPSSTQRQPGSRISANYREDRSTEL